MKNIFFKCIVLSLMISATACEKQTVGPLEPMKTEELSLTKRAVAKQVIAVGWGYYGTVQSQSDCKTTGSGCLYSDFRLFDGSVEEAIAYVDKQGAENCVVRISLASDEEVNFELLYATDAYEQEVQADRADFSSFTVGPKDVYLSSEISTALGLGMIRLNAGTYKVQRESRKRYWSGSVLIQSLRGPLLLLEKDANNIPQIFGQAICSNPTFNAYGARYILDPVTYNFYYLGNWPHGLDIEISTTPSSANAVLNEFDANCLDPDRDRTTINDFLCNAVAVYPESLDPNTDYYFRLHIAGYPASSPWYHFRTPNTYPCMN